MLGIELGTYLRRQRPGPEADSVLLARRVKIERMSRAFRRLLTLSVTAALAVPLSAYAGAADAQPGERGKERRAATVKFVGRGYGHGKGMSQWGAHDAAQRGKTHKQILKFYYPHTKLGRKGGRLKVEITGDTSRDVVVVDRGGLKVKALDSGRSWEPRVDANRWRIKPASGGKSVVSYRKGGWHAWKTFAGEGQFSAGNKPLTLVTPSGNVAYRGALRSARIGTRHATVNVVSLDGYVKGVVPQEVPAEWPKQSVRAQAVAARTYAAFLRADGDQPICDTTSCQVYGGYSAEHPASNAAVQATRRRIVTYKTKPAFTQFSASNGGWTVQGQVHGANVSYLPAKQDPYDDAYRRWTATFTGREIVRHFQGLGTFDTITVIDRDGHGDWNGRALRVRVKDTDGNAREADADDFMLWIGLRSTWFKRPVVSG
jgi:stage II sporulation protein D